MEQPDAAALGRIRSQVSDTFRLHCYTIKADALSHLGSLLAAVTQHKDRQLWLDSIVAVLQKQNLDSAVLGVSEIDAAVAECSQRDNDQQSVFEVVDVFRKPQLHYSSERKRLVDRTSANLPPACLFAGAQSKCELYRQRFAIIQQRVVRHELFASGSASTSGGGHKFILRTVEELLGSGGRLDDVVILAMIVQLKPDALHLEDPSGTVELDVSRSEFHAGLFVENSVVLVEGDYVDGVLRAKAVGHPPVESAHAANKALAMPPASDKLRHIELSRQDATIILLNDVHLDSQHVLTALRSMFDGFAQCPPVAFVLCGSFCSQPFGDNHHQTIKDGIKRLADLICEFDTLRSESHFVLVPSSSDPVMGQILPRPSLPRSLASPLLDRVANAHLASNPCIVRYCTQNVLVFSEDVVEKLCRNALRMPSQHADVPEHVCRTLQAQSHVCPVPVHVSPVYWDMDSALRLYPLPHLLVLADTYQPFTHTMNQCTVTCLGSFSRNGFTFQVYFPASRTIEDSAITDDA